MTHRIHDRCRWFGHKIVLLQQVRLSGPGILPFAPILMNLLMQGDAPRPLGYIRPGRRGYLSYVIRRRLALDLWDLARATLGIDLGSWSLRAKSRAAVCRDERKWGESEWMNTARPGRPAPSVGRQSDSATKERVGEGIVAAILGPPGKCRLKGALPTTPAPGRRLGRRLRWPRAPASSPCAAAIVRERFQYVVTSPALRQCSRIMGQKNQTWTDK